MSESTLEQLRNRLRTLELESVDVKARAEEIRSLIALLEQQPRPGRPRRVTLVEDTDEGGDAA